MSSNLQNFRASVVVTSDTCSRDPSQDTSGEYVVEQLKSISFGEVIKYIVPDEAEEITNLVKQTIDNPKNVLTITVGGTGLCPRDVTPEATSVLYDKTCLGIAVALHMTSLRYTPKAALSRLTAGISKSCLIVNFPGKQKACKDCFSCLMGFLEHALEQIRFNAQAIEQTHRKLDSKEHQVIAEDLSKLTLQEPSECKKSGMVSSVATNPDASGVDKPVASVVEKQEIVDDSVNSSKISRKRLSQTHSPYPLMEYEHVLDIMSNLLHELQYKAVEIPLDSMDAAQAALGSVLACDLVSKRVIPPHRASVMDGYLLNVPDNMLNKLHVLKTIQAIYLDDLACFQKAQVDSFMKNKFFCCQINTGGKVPNTENCHIAVVPFEDTSLSNSSLNTISISNIQLNKFIRDIGSDLNEGDSLRAGTIIRSPELAIILSMGYSSISVIESPTIGVFSSGNELVEPFGPQNGVGSRVLDTNGPLLTTLYRSRGYKAISFGILKDNPAEISERITTSLKKCDVLVITGGASMGTGDHMKNVLLNLGGTIHFGRVNIKPGKPAALASLVVDGGVMKFVFCLPGNPVSAYITSLVLVLPFLEEGFRNHLGHYSGGISLQSLGELVEVQLASITDDGNVDGATREAEYTFDGRLEFVRATRVKPDTWDSKSRPLVSVSIKQQSSRLLSLRDCDWLIVIEPSRKGSKFLVGQLYPALLLNWNH